MTLPYIKSHLSYHIYGVITMKVLSKREDFGRTHCKFDLQKRAGVL